MTFAEQMSSGIKLFSIDELLFKFAKSEISHDSIVKGAGQVT